MAQCPPTHALSAHPLRVAWVLLLPLLTPRGRPREMTTCFDQQRTTLSQVTLGVGTGWRLEVVDWGELILPAFGPPRPLRQALIFPSRTTGLGLVTLAWASGSFVSLAFITWSPPSITNYIGCISAILSLSLFYMLPETQNLPHSDTLDHFPLYRMR